MVLHFILNALIKMVERNRKKFNNDTDSKWLESEPPKSEVESNPNGSRFIPIEYIRALLDRLNGTVKNYRVQLYRDGIGMAAAGSLELTVTIDGKERTVTGAYNLKLNEAIGGYWNGSLKSDCIKNAAAELGRRLGRDLNIGNDAPTIAKQQLTIQERVKMKPDSKIMKQFLTAIEKKDQAAITALTNIYDIKTEGIDA